MESLAKAQRITEKRNNRQSEWRLILLSDLSVLARERKFALPCGIGISKCKVQIEECKMQGKLHKTEWNNLTFAICNFHFAFTRTERGLSCLEREEP